MYTLLQLAKSQWCVRRFSSSGLFRLLKQSDFMLSTDFLSPVVLQGGACGGFPRDGGGQGGGGGGAGGEGGGVGGVGRRWGVARAPGVGGRCQWEGQGVAHARAVT